MSSSGRGAVGPLPGSPFTPARLLRAEGALVLVVATAGYARLTGDRLSWWPFALGFLAPDLAILGYAAGPGAGATAYNIAHTEVFPLLLLGIGMTIGQTGLVVTALIWLAHIGFDRLLGYGLKYPTSFKDTHLQRLTRPFSDVGNLL